MSDTDQKYPKNSDLLIMELQPHNIQEEHKNDAYINEEQQIVEEKQKINTENLITSEFVSPAPYDISCRDISKCNAIKRVIHILKYYESKRVSKEFGTGIIPLYEYISSHLQDKNYSVAGFMEDLYRCVNNHFRTKKDLDWFSKYTQINCAETRVRCSYFQRFTRARGHVTYNVDRSVDHANIILIDKLDAFHTFVFHTLPQKFSKTNQFPRIIKQVDTNTESDENQPNKFITMPSPNDEKSAVSYYSFGQQFKYTENLNSHPLYIKPKYKDIKQEIFEYFKAVNLTLDTINLFESQSNTVKSMDVRVKSILTNFNDIQFELSRLFASLTQYELSELANDEKKTDILFPKSIATCSLQQVVSILSTSDVFDDLEVLIQYKSEIINYFKNNWFNGSKLVHTIENDFVTQVSGYLHKVMSIHYSKLWIDSSNVAETSELIDVLQLQKVNWLQWLTLFQRINYGKLSCLNAQKTLFGHISLDLKTIQNEFEYFAQYIMFKMLDLQFKARYDINMTKLQKQLDTVNNEDWQQMVKSLKKVEYQYQNAGAFRKQDQVNIPFREKNKLSASKKTFADLMTLIFNGKVSSKLQKIINNHLTQEKYLKQMKITQKSLLSELQQIITLFFKKKYFDIIKLKIYSYSSLKQCILNWSENNTQIDTASSHIWTDFDSIVKSIQNYIKSKPISVEEIETLLCDKLANLQKALMKIFEMSEFDLEKQLQNYKQQYKSRFILVSTRIINSSFMKNRENYIKIQNEKRYEHYFEKARIQLSMSSVKKLKAVWYYGENNNHGIAMNQPIQIDHLFALNCYTDEAALCTQFRATYRFEHTNESLEQLKQRHTCFGNFGKLLFQSFAFFASKESKRKELYHGISQELSFSALYCAFNAPTSTTSDPNIAEQFCYVDGIVLKFESCESSPHIRTLDMSLFSRFIAEKEHLIFETRLKINDISIPTTRGWIGERLMNALSLFDALVHGNDIHGQHLLKVENQKTLCKLLTNIMNDELKSDSEYFKTLSSSLVTQNKEIWINPKQFSQLYPELRRMFLSDADDEFGIFIKYLKKTYKNVSICPIFMTAWKMSQHTFDLITRVEDKYENIAIHGRNVVCKLSEDKQIVFRPQLTKVQDLFFVKMELIDVYNDIPIVVHFNIHCEELGNYYTSLHPRLMDTKNYKHFNIALPAIQQVRSVNKMDNEGCCCCSPKQLTLKTVQEKQTITLAMSVMIHHFSDFDIDVNSTDLDIAKLAIMTHDMVQQQKSYKCADILSVFYGISNSIISVLESISNIVFIIFLWYYTDIDDAGRIIIDILFILSVGNLVSVAIIISAFVCYQSQIQSRGQLFLYFIVFFILSPIVALFRWVMSILSIQNEDFLNVTPDHDPILLWFRQELIRNALFLIECVFESCTQVIIQFIAMFILEGGVNIYLYVSIVVSLLVIMTKCVLMSYNLQRIAMVLNNLCYVMDIMFSLIIGMFIASFTLHHIFTLTGLYFSVESLIFVLFYCSYCAHLSSIPYLSVPILILLFFPLTILSISGLSIYPLLSYLTTDPTKIGETEEFYKALYAYCNDGSETEFNTKIIIVNYVCVKSYQSKLSKLTIQNETYFAFAQWLLKQRQSNLQDITLKELNQRANHSFYNKLIQSLDVIIHSHGIKVAQLLYAKVFHTAVRTIMITLCILLDLLYLENFNKQSPLMKIYGNVFKVFGLSAAVLLLVWLCIIVYERYLSRWHTFCYHMIGAKHSKFVLITSVQQFIQQCDEIFLNQTRKSKSSHKNWLKVPLLSETPAISFEIIQEQKYQPTRVAIADSNELKGLSLQMITLICVATIIIIRIFWPFNNCIQRRNILSISTTVQMCVTICICSLTIFGNLVCGQKTNNIFDIKSLSLSIIFSLLSSSLFTNFYIAYVYENISQCGYGSINGLEFVGCMICCIPSSVFAKIWEMRALLRIEFFAQPCALIFIAVTISKDIAALVISSQYNCNSTVDDSKYVSFDVSQWILIGSITHMSSWGFIILCGICLLNLLKQVATFLFLVMGCCSSCFLIAWVVIGFLLHSEMHGEKEECMDIVLSWCIIQLIEPVFIICFGSYLAFYD
eukprot:265456_1